MRYAITFFALLAAASLALAWHHQGHASMSRGAVVLLPEDVPAFFREGGEAIAHFSIDPDVHRHRAQRELRSSEAPEHFFDMELLQGAAVPRTRAQMLRWCAEHDVAPDKLGAAPYAIIEHAQRLTLAFAEHRRWPDNEHIRAKCLLYAGLLAHYAQDLCMPLHTTIHYDGRVGPDGRSPHTGVHAKIDALPGKLELDIDALRAAGAIEPFDDSFTGVVDTLNASHALVDRAYELEPHYPEVENKEIAHDEVRQFATERSAAATRFTARLLLTAWRNSAEIELEDWLER